MRTTRSTRSLSHPLVLGVAFALACGQPRPEDRTKGGDHVPEEKTYALTEALPDVAFVAGLEARAYRAPFLRPYLHLAERYDICFDAAETPAPLLAAIEERLRTASGPLQGRGLEAVVNHALATLRGVRPEIPGFSSRIALAAVWHDGGSCHLLVQRRAADRFPFADADFADARTALFYPGQLRDASGRVNALPVAYLREGLDQAATVVAAQLNVARYLGLGASTSTQSFLHPDADPAVHGGLAWQFDESGAVGADGPALYAFALAFAEVLKPRDLEGFHHYADTLGFAAPEQDPALTLTLAQTPPRFVATPGHPHLDGVRLASGALRVCVDGADALVPSDAVLADALGFVAADAEGMLGAAIRAVDPAYDVAPVVVRDGACNLVVAFRDEASFPFKGRPYNGLYAHEGKITDAAGAPVKVPLIYLNRSNLTASRDEATSGGQKWLGHVLRHELAHALGFKHARSPRSILSPAGYNEALDLDGGDRAMIEAWAQRAAQARSAD